MSGWSSECSPGGGRAAVPASARGGRRGAPTRSNARLKISNCGWRRWKRPSPPRGLSTRRDRMRHNRRHRPRSPFCIERLMRVLDASAVETLETEPLVEQLRQAFRGGGIVPPRHHHTIRVPGTEDATLLLMPAWQEGRYLGTKIVTVFPGNNARSLSSVAGTYVLMSGRTGEPLLVADGRMLTLRRTAAASALAAKYLARQDAHRLLMIGTGALAPPLILAHATVRPIREVAIWSRSPEKAERLARTLSNRYLTVTATRDLAGAVTAADVISCATLSQEPLIRGEWLKPGQHLDLVGGFTPSMREADDDAIDRSRVYVDSPVSIY